MPTGENRGSQDGARASGVPGRRNTEREIFLPLQLTLIRAVPSEGALLRSQRGEGCVCRAAPKKLSSRTAPCENRVTAEQNSTTRWKIFPGYINMLQTAKGNPLPLSLHRDPPPSSKCLFTSQVVGIVQRQTAAQSKHRQPF